MHLSTFFEMQVLESMCHSFAKYSYKYMEVKHQLELLYFQVEIECECWKETNFENKFS